MEAGSGCTYLPRCLAFQHAPGDARHNSLISFLYLADRQTKHNDSSTFFWVYVLPNGVWILVPFLAVLSLIRSNVAVHKKKGE